MQLRPLSLFEMMLAVRITLAHFSISLTTNCRKYSGDDARATTAPQWHSVLCTDGVSIVARPRFEVYNDRRWRIAGKKIEQTIACTKISGSLAHAQLLKLAEGDRSCDNVMPLPSCPRYAEE